MIKPNMKYLKDIQFVFLAPMTYPYKQFWKTFWCSNVQFTHPQFWTYVCGSKTALINKYIMVLGTCCMLIRETVVSHIHGCYHVSKAALPYSLFDLAHLESYNSVTVGHRNIFRGQQNKYSLVTLLRVKTSQIR